MLGVGQIDGERGPRVVWGDMQHVRLLDACASELPGIGVIADFEHMAVDVRGVSCQEGLDVVTIDALAPLRAEDPPDGLQPPEGTKAYLPYWRLARWTLGGSPPPQTCRIAQQRAQHSPHSSSMSSCDMAIAPF